MNASRPSRVNDRNLRIELLCVRASYERLELARSVDGLRRHLSPGALADSAKHSLRAQGLTWLAGMLGVARRAPWLSTLAVALLGTSRRRRIATKVALVAGLVWLGRQRKP